MNEPHVLRILERIGVVVDGHFVCSGGRHTAKYVNKDAIYSLPWVTKSLCNEIVGEIGLKVEYDTVVSPEKGGISLSQWIAYNSDSRHQRQYLGVFAVYAEKEVIVVAGPGGNGWKYFAETGSFVIKRDYAKFVGGKRVFVADDVITTGDSVRKVIEAVRDVGGDVVGCGVIWNRGKVTAQDVGVPKLVALVDKEFETWDEENCPLCEQNIPINENLGHDREFLARRHLQER